MRWRALFILLGLLTSVAASPSEALARTRLDVAMGWGDWVRPGRWSPIFVTASDDTTRAVVVQLEVPQAGSDVMRLQQFITLGPQETTITLYAPFHETYGEKPVVVLRDANTQKLLARWPEDDSPFANARIQQSLQSDQRLIGLSGAGSRIDTFVNDLNSGHRTGFIEPRLLPTRSVGYDTVDLLVLNRPNLSEIEPSSQQAIVDWVRAGGCMLMWPSDEPTPTDSPLGSVLPCKVGQPKNYPITDEQRKAADLSKRHQGIQGFELAPIGNAEALELLPTNEGGSNLTAYARSYGFGRIIVAPINLSQLSYDSVPSKGYIRERLLVGTGLLPEKEGAERTTYYGYDPIISLQTNATTELRDHLANVPGAGRFGFSYVVWVILGMMVLVGPVDWFVLRLLGRQPWTWATTAGWIGVITCSALFIGSWFKSGELHYRTVALVDQADDQVIARTTLAGAYSPRTTTYNFDAAPTQTDAEGKPIPTKLPPVGWWDPASAETYGGGIQTDVGFRQGSDGNVPQPTTINVWNIRFLRGENLTPGDPMIRADLKLTSRNGAHTLEGTITNLSSSTLKDVRVQTKEGFAGSTPATSPQKTEQENGYNGTQVPTRGLSDTSALLFSRPIVAQIAPGETVKISTPIQGEPTNPLPNVDPNTRYYRYDDPPPAPEIVWGLIPGLSGQRTFRSNQIVARGTHAVVYASIADAKPSVVLRESDGTHERHEAVLRALVRLQSEK